MTSGAQQALRRTMEIYSNTTRFALACNLSSKIIEPIQSRCAIIRFSKLTEEQVLSRIVKVVEAEKVPHVSEGLEAIVFTADGDMRQGLNNLQATFSGFGVVNQENVFKVCDQPHPLLVSSMIGHCTRSALEDAHAAMKHLFDQGYSATDIISTVFRVTKSYAMPEYLKLEFIREIGFTHVRITDGVGTFLQLCGMLAKLCKVAANAKP
ncbi:Subunit of heteropentameric Replication factor C (RF-C) [Cymbomonas tetramitiformis]|uniref:Subunit of heteropentameric Replication factor C (RF-C) n=1 Tax=Cymbomonas tetramitiformis TaxID=36881 RepID=A0AAE0F460_9CHLO|nr:Subunit of heteropentameric Replication factor C (RF-C) [Cymbomonas tetramitiformis]